MVGGPAVSLDVQIAHRVEEIGEEAWDSLGPERPFASYRWYRFGEAVLTDDLPIYVILSWAGEPVARATFWLKRRETLPVSSEPLRQLVERILRRWPLLACRSPMSGTSGLILPDPPLRDTALEIIVEHGRELLQAHGASVLLFDYLDSTELDLPGWPHEFAKVREIGPGTQLAIAWPDFDSYLACMPKKQRYNIRRTCRLVADEGIEIKQYRSVIDVDKAMELHQHVNARYSAPVEVWMRGAMANADMVDAVWLTARKEGHLVGSELMLGDRGAWLVTGLGLDPGLKNVYFVLGYEDIRYAIEHGAWVLRWGAETYSVKERLGFEPESNSSLVFASRWPWFQKIGRWIAENGLYQREAGPSNSSASSRFPTDGKEGYNLAFRQSESRVVGNSTTGGRCPRLTQGKQVGQDAQVCL